MTGIRLNYEYVKQFFADQGCELLENDYKNARTKLRYKCVCKTISNIVFDSFRRGNRCRLCGNKKCSAKQSLTHDEVAAKFKEQGCTLLDQYRKSQMPMRYVCVCGEEAVITWNNFQRGELCKKCGIAKRSGERHYEWRSDRKAKHEEYLFRQRSYKLLKMTMKVTGRVKNNKTAALLGYDYKQLQEYIKNHPNFDKVKGGKWHIDHIFPISAFVKHGITDIALINSLDNLQPLGHIDNIKKSDSFDSVAFEHWLRSKGWSIK